MAWTANGITSSTWILRVSQRVLASYCELTSIGQRSYLTKTFGFSSKKRSRKGEKWCKTVKVKGDSSDWKWDTAWVPPGGRLPDSENRDSSGFHQCNQNQTTYQGWGKPTTDASI
ncbi:hypothetical protein PGT21_028438 [Puccinia graminis f. sp. tritici]|uniref:Uncharacterized protein n=1 Tax=Puccinia graminis f. sp. tritici TaxID=56615 RepID=A0A5B0RVL9_PUCGR|nr:hypothetical protein PGT21_028438 [Puccinia graminis f. sp. tritici]KAA1129830.1 hypothetical protein PGTUg99_004010 [Puccinia graminis f. sp. tritici]